MAEKHQLIVEIRELNPSAAHDWLSAFSASELLEYLEHLHTSFEPATAARWVRRSDAPAFSMRECA